MRHYLNTDELILVIKAIRGQVRRLEVEIDKARVIGNKRQEVGLKYRLSIYRNIAKKFREDLRDRTNVIHVIEDEFDV